MTSLSLLPGRIVLKQLQAIISPLLNVKKFYLHCTFVLLLHCIQYLKSGSIKSIRISVLMQFKGYMKIRGSSAATKFEVKLHERLFLFTKV